VHGGEPGQQPGEHIIHRRSYTAAARSGVARSAQAG
jgi:hypothetical protein